MHSFVAVIQQTTGDRQSPCGQRDRLKQGQPRRSWRDGSTTKRTRRLFSSALEEVGRLVTREGWRYQHVQAIIVEIDQYAEAATGNRDFFLNKPPNLVGKAKGDIP
jgi:hypothetical protein